MTLRWTATAWRDEDRRGTIDVGAACFIVYFQIHANTWEPFISGASRLVAFGWKPKEQFVFHSSTKSQRPHVNLPQERTGWWNQVQLQLQRCTNVLAVVHSCHCVSIQQVERRWVSGRTILPRGANWKGPSPVMARKRTQPCEVTFMTDLHDRFSHFLMWTCRML